MISVMHMLNKIHLLTVFNIAESFVTSDNSAYFSKNTNA